MRKRKQFTRVDRVLETMLDTHICSEGYLDMEHRHIVKWGFYPRPYTPKQVVLFDTKTGRYQLGQVEIGSIGIYTDCEGYSIKDLRKMIAEIYPRFV